MAKKYTITITVVALIALGAFVWFKKGQQPEPTEKMVVINTSTTTNQNINSTTNNPVFKTYRNEEWGFEFQYPLEAEINHKQPFYKNDGLNLTITNPPPNNNLITVGFFINDWSKDNLIVKLLNQNIVSEASMHNGIAYKYEADFGSGYNIEYLIPKGRYWVIISGEKENQKVIDAVFSSLKFFEPYNTYRNEKLGFEFNFPSNWVINREYAYGNLSSKFLVIVSNPVVINGSNGVNDLALDDSFTVSVVPSQSVDNSFQFLDKTVSSVIVDGIYGQKFEYEFKGFSHTTIVLPLGDSKILLGTGDGSKPYVEELNQILSTFRFIESAKP